MRPLFIQLKVNDEKFFINSNEIKIIKTGKDFIYTCIILNDGTSYELPIEMREFIESFNYNPYVVRPRYR